MELGRGMIYTQDDNNECQYPNPFTVGQRVTTQRPSGDYDCQTDTQASDLGTYMLALVNAVDEGIRDEAAPFDLTSVEYSLLSACMERGEATATQLAVLLPVDTSRISRMVNGLVERGLLTRRRMSDDRRVVMLRLSEEGNEVTLNIRRRVEVYYATLTQDVSEEEMSLFLSTMLKMLANYTATRPPQ